ncbi:MAG: CvpA family protein [Candidatus Omnitrophica bacterium]|nr:CvpA family protein [Candidatus Omnitrophota bacterium]
MPNFIRQINWVDLFVITLLLRVCYVAAGTGILIESFKIAGTIFATYFSLHYYSDLAGFLKDRFGSEYIPLTLLEFISFFILAFGVYLLFVFLRKIFCRFVKMEAVENLNKWGGLIIGVIRGLLLISLFTFGFVLSNISYFQESLQHSYTGRRIFYLAPSVYRWSWENIASKFSSDDKMNEAVLKAEDKIKEK